ncbi:MAG: hypothetical protein KJS77_03160 [Planctomycetes bacterium]|nr:hypothetical protein [Planctomycetota bacterium]
MINFLLLGLFLVVTFALWREGLWSSAIMLLNTLAAATFATAWYEAVVAFLIKRGLSSYDYLLDFLCIWGLFAIILLVLRETSDRVSRTKVRFRKPVELFGCPVVAAAAAWIVVCFTAATLHTAAVPRDLIQATPEARMFFGLAPDRCWLQWVRGSTLHGPFARPEHAFDKQADFIVRYATRRKQLESQPELRVRR